MVLPICVVEGCERLAKMNYATCRQHEGVRKMISVNTTALTTFQCVAELCTNTAKHGFTTCKEHGVFRCRKMVENPEDNTKFKCGEPVSLGTRKCTGGHIVYFYSDYAHVRECKACKKSYNIPHERYEKGGMWYVRGGCNNCHNPECVSHCGIESCLIQSGP